MELSITIAILVGWQLSISSIWQTYLQLVLQTLFNTVQRLSQQNQQSVFVVSD